MFLDFLHPKRMESDILSATDSTQLFFNIVSHHIYSTFSLV